MSKQSSRSLNWLGVSDAQIGRLQDLDLNRSAVATDEFKTNQVQKAADVKPQPVPYREPSSKKET